MIQGGNAIGTLVVLKHFSKSKIISKLNFYKTIYLGSQQFW